MPDIGFRIKKKREECGLTQEELAVKLWVQKQVNDRED